MHITELRLHGFKSFVDAARAPIEPGLTGVVGPNGCGKSNLLEGVRWVMGAASARALRATDMDDVIFAGSAGRPPRETAEVTLVLANAAGKLDGDFARADVLEVSRRIKRGAGSSYRINGKEVRAKDVQLLFADAATGANSPALVRQGQVSDLIASKPENRRKILEDAAGIAGLHARRHEADLKLRAAETNLTRLDEIMAEIDAQAASLAKQARQAERYRGLADTIRQTEAVLLHRRWRDALDRKHEAEARAREAERDLAEAAAASAAAFVAEEEARAALAPLREEEAIAAAVLRRLEGARVGLERDLGEAEAEVARAAEGIKRAEEERARLSDMQSDAQAARQVLESERASLQASGADADALRDLIAAADEAEEKRRAADAALEAMTAAIAAERARIEASRNAVRQAENAVARAEAALVEIERRKASLGDAGAQNTAKEIARAAAQAASAKAQAAREALAAAEAVAKSFERAGEAAWTALRKAERAQSELAAERAGLEKIAVSTSGKFAPVLKDLKIAPGFERALAAALGDDVEASLEREALSRWAGRERTELVWPDGVQPLDQFVEAPTALSARLAFCGVVADEDGARLIATMPPGVRLVSPSGALWRWDGFVRAADAPSPAAAKIAQQARLTALRDLCAKAEADAQAAKAAQEKAAAQRRDGERALSEARRAIASVGAEASNAGLALERAEREAQWADTQRRDLEAERARRAAERDEAKAALETIPQTPQGILDEAPLIAAREAAHSAREGAIQAAAARDAFQRAEAARTQRLAAIETELAAWARRASASEGRHAALDAEIAALAQKRAASEARPASIRAALSKLMDEAADSEARRARAADALATGEAGERAAAARTRASEAAHGAARETRATAAAALQGAAERVEEAERLSQEIAGCAADRLAERAGGLLSGALGNAPLNEVERRLDRLRAERDAGGPVNLRAEEELSETRARQETLTRERADVAAAAAKLRGAITRLNNEGRTRLLAAFEQVNAHFEQLFTALFEGGSARLTLTETEDPLMAALEIYAQPPGKKLSALSLMSGGEQALTATALIFAVFLANPAPICVLDEVDAPLDDANVDRFCRLLDETRKRTETRFLVITHNPVTMSRMDRLYGVTMPEQGISQLVSVDLAGAQTLAGV